MIVLIFGGPGTGKSTYAKYLAEKLNLSWVSTGQVFRELAKHDDRIRGILESGQLLPDAEVNQILFKKLTESDGNFVLDGFPRDLPQAKSFTDFLKSKNWKIDHIFHLTAPVEVIVARLAARGRADDNPETIKERFEVFEAETKPVIALLESSGSRVTEIGNSPPIEEVKKEIDNSLKKS